MKAPRAENLASGHTSFLWEAKSVSSNAIDFATHTAVPICAHISRNMLKILLIGFCEYEGVSYEGNAGIDAVMITKNEDATTSKSR